MSFRYRPQWVAVGYILALAAVGLVLAGAAAGHDRVRANPALLPDAHRAEMERANVPEQLRDLIARDEPVPLRELAKLNAGQKRAVEDARAARRSREELAVLLFGAGLLLAAGVPALGGWALTRRRALLACASCERDSPDAGPERGSGV